MVQAYILIQTEVGKAASVAEQIAGVLKQVPGTGDLRVQRMLGLPLLDVSVDRLRLARHGIPAAEVLAAVEAARAGA